MGTTHDVLDEAMNSAKFGRGFQDSVHEAFRISVCKALKELLESKHLYQKVHVELSNVERAFKGSTARNRRSTPTRQVPATPERSPAPISFIQAELAKKFFGGVPDKRVLSWAESPWSISLFGNRLNDKSIDLSPPPISVTCANCKKGPWPHNPGFTDAISATFSTQLGSFTDQVFIITYQCQHCRGEPLCFMIKRQGFILSLVGRSHFPEVTTPVSLPASLSKLYRSAIIASKTGFILAAALYLRSAIERHFRDAIPPDTLKALGSRPTGEELGDSYAKTLPKEFPANFPSLRKAYSDLSEVIHRGNEDEPAIESFEKTKLAVEHHFEALGLIRRVKGVQIA